MELENQLEEKKDDLDKLVEIMKASGIKHMEIVPIEKTKEVLMKDSEESKYASSFDCYVF